MVRQHYIFYGRVQGVGFRYRACKAAESLGLTGYVRNNYDGSVEMEVQGERPQIGRMIQMLQNGTFIHIEDYQMKELPVNEEERWFREVD